MTFDFDGKNWAIRIIFTLSMIFFVVAIVMSIGFRPETKSMGQKVWEVFMMANGALFLLLNAEGKKQIGIPDDTTDAKVEQSTTLTQETKVTTPDPEKVP